MNDDSALPDPGNLDRAISELREIAIPEPPSAALLLARLPVACETTPPIGLGQRVSGRRSILGRSGFRLTTASILLLLPVGWLLLSAPRGNALAQAIATTAKHEIARCKFVTSAHFDGVGPAKSEETLYFDLKSPRFRVDRHEKTLNGTVSATWNFVQDNRRDRVLVMSNLQLIVSDDAANEMQRKTIEMIKNDGSLGKRAKLFLTSSKGLSPFTNAKTDKTLLEILREFQDHKKVVALEDTLDGRNTMKYRLEEQDRTSTLWVDMETKLPVRIEEDRPRPTETARDWKWILSDFEWDVDGKRDEVFSVDPPDGYVFEDHTKDTDND
jgi:hypothetical protein